MLKSWTGTPPKKCDICHTPITEEFIDGKIALATTWAFFCPKCHEAKGSGLGLSLGQRYKLTAWEGEEIWLKVEG